MLLHLGDDSGSGWNACFPRLHNIGRGDATSLVGLHGLFALFKMGATSLVCGRRGLCLLRLGTVCPASLVHGLGGTMSLVQGLADLCPLRLGTVCPASLVHGLGGTMSLVQGLADLCPLRLGTVCPASLVLGLGGTMSLVQGLADLCPLRLGTVCPASLVLGLGGLSESGDSGELWRSSSVLSGDILDTKCCTRCPQKVFGVFAHDSSFGDRRQMLPRSVGVARRLHLVPSSSWSTPTDGAPSSVEARSTDGHAAPKRLGESITCMISPENRKRKTLRSFTNLPTLKSSDSGLPCAMACPI